MKFSIHWKLIDKQKLILFQKMEFAIVTMIIQIYIFTFQSRHDFITLELWIIFFIHLKGNLKFEPRLVSFYFISIFMFLAQFMVVLNNSLLSVSLHLSPNTLKDLYENKFFEE